MKQSLFQQRNGLKLLLFVSGDHQQLRPSTAVYELAKNYHLDISLFERMLKNGLCCHTLGIQHRMKPEIASLIVPSIYPSLQNDLSVYSRGDISGVASNLFFVTHTNFEDEVKINNKKEFDTVISYYNMN